MIGRYLPRSVCIECVGSKERENITVKIGAARLDKDKASL